jgi:uncharacterized repeat protein (TIGR01451 family)
MSRARKSVTLLAATALLLVGTGATMAFAQNIATTSAKATGLSVYADLLGTHLLDLKLPNPGAKAPDPSSSTPDSNVQTLLGPIRQPADGSLISEISVLKTVAKRTETSSSAEAEATRVWLLEQAGKPLIQVDVLQANSDTKCVNGKASSTGAVKILGLHINGQGLDIPSPQTNGQPAPNTEINIPAAGSPYGIKIILNEQKGAANGNGLIVTALHVIVYGPDSPNLLYADVYVSRAESTAFCGPNNPPTDNNPGSEDVRIDKIVTKTDSDPAGATDGTTATAHRGENVTWKITINNKSSNACSLLQVTDTLPPHFTFVSSAGDLTTANAPSQNGQDLTWRNNGRWPLAANGTLTETITAKVDADAPYGTYTNLLDVDQSTCSSFTEGNGGPVTVIPTTAKVLGKKVTKPKPALKATEVSPGAMPRTGNQVPAPAVALTAIFMIGAGVGFRILRRTH